MTVYYIFHCGGVLPVSKTLNPGEIDERFICPRCKKKAWTEVLFEAMESAA